MVYIYTIAGAVLGAALLDESGLIFGGLLGYLLFRQIELKQTVSKLEEQLSAGPQVPPAEAAAPAEPEPLY